MTRRSDRMSIHYATRCCAQGRRSLEAHEQPSVTSDMGALLHQKLPSCKSGWIPTRFSRGTGDCRRLHSDSRWWRITCAVTQTSHDLHQAGGSSSSNSAVGAPLREQAQLHDDGHADKDQRSRWLQRRCHPVQPAKPRLQALALFRLFIFAVALALAGLAGAPLLVFIQTASYQACAAWLCVRNACLHPFTKAQAGQRHDNLQPDDWPSPVLAGLLGTVPVVALAVRHGRVPAVQQLLVQLAAGVVLQAYTRFLLVTLLRSPHILRQAVELPFSVSRLLLMQQLLLLPQLRQPVDVLLGAAAGAVMLLASFARPSMWQRPSVPQRGAALQAL